MALLDYIEVKIDPKQDRCKDDEIAIFFDQGDGPGILTLERHTIVKRSFLKERDGKNYVLAEPGHGSCKLDFGEELPLPPTQFEIAFKEQMIIARARDLFNKFVHQAPDGRDQKEIKEFYELIREILGTSTD